MIIIMIMSMAYYLENKRKQEQARKIKKNLFSKLKLKCFINKIKEINKTGPTINICATKNPKGS